MGVSLTDLVKWEAFLLFLIIIILIGFRKIFETLESHTPVRRAGWV